MDTALTSRIIPTITAAVIVAAEVAAEVAEVEAAAVVAAAARIIPIAPSNVATMMPTACCAQVFAPAQTIVTIPCAAQTCQSAATTVLMVLINMV